MHRTELQQMLERMLRERRVSRSAQAGVDPADVDPTVARARAREALQIEEALEKLRAGTYGECSRCGAEIDQARLKARPFATQCVHCTTKAERRWPRREVASIMFPYLY